MTSVLKIHQSNESPRLGGREGISPSYSPKRKQSPARSEVKSPTVRTQKGHQSSGKNLIKLNFMSQQEQGFEEFVVHKDPGNPPIFIFMPSRDQLNKMILKALKFDTPEMIV